MRAHTIAVAPLVAVVVGCATPPASSPRAASLDACSLRTESACVAWGASVAGVPATPSAQLTVGLADRVATLSAEEERDAADYWRRIAEIVDASDQSSELVNRRAAPAYASLAALEVELMREPGADADLAEVFVETQAALVRLRERAEFAVRWGAAPTQARAARALADGYGRQATVLRAVEFPAELTEEARAAFEAKRTALVDELVAEQERLMAGVATHCRAYELRLPACVPPSELQPEL